MKATPNGDPSLTSRPVYARPPGAIGEPMVFRSGDNPFEVLVLMEWEELEMARKWAVSDELKAAMEESGVNDEPTTTFLTQV